jgi:tetratricopeptide (TPR) repeat protein
MSPRAQAQPDHTKQEAKSHYEKATRLYDVGKYGESIQEYEAAYLLIEDPALLYNIGQAYRLWDKPEEAVRAYKNYLRKRPDASNRGEVERRISDLERIIEERRRSMAPAPVMSAPAGVAPVGAEPLPASPVASVGPVAAPAAPAGGPDPSPISAPVAVPATRPSAQPDIGTAPPSSSISRSGGRIVPYAFMGVGGASLLTSVVAGLYAHSQAQKVVNASNNYETYNPEWQSRGRAANTVAIVSGVSGLVLAGTGLYLLWTSTPREHAAWAGHKRTAILPVAGPGFAGAAALVDF